MLDIKTKRKKKHRHQMMSAFQCAVHFTSFVIVCVYVQRVDVHRVWCGLRRTLESLQSLTCLYP